MSDAAPPPASLDQILYMGIRSDPAKITASIWCAISAAAVALLLGKILVDTARYYDYFGVVDKIWVRIGVAMGALASVALLTVILIKYAEHDFHSIFTLDNTLGYACDCIGACLNITASSYYTWRTYKLSGRKVWLWGCLMILNLVTFAMGLLVTIKGMTAPAATMETAMELKAFYTRIIPWYKVWGGFSMTSDGLVCSCMIFFLFRSSTSVFHQRGNRIFHKLNTLFLETMMAPVLAIGVFIIGVESDPKASPTGDWRRLARAMIPPLFFVSLIHSLVARAVIQRMLSGQLASDGIHPRANGRSNVFVASMPALGDRTSVEDHKRDMEASTDHIIQLDKMPSFQRSASPVFDTPVELGERVPQV